MNGRKLQLVATLKSAGDVVGTSGVVKRPELTQYTWSARVYRMTGAPKWSCKVVARLLPVVAQLVSDIPTDQVVANTDIVYHSLC